MKYIYGDKVLQQLRLFIKESYELQIMFTKGNSIDTLLVGFKKLKERLHGIDELLPPDFYTESELNRHMSFIELYLKKNQPDNCLSDIIEICERDIDKLESDYIKYVNTRFVDLQLTDNIMSLLESGHFDSAIRKASLTLTERLRLKYGILAEKDGKELVNEIFGQKSLFNSTMPKDKKEAYRDFYSGIYGLVRNEYMHNMKEPNNIEAEYILNLINFALLKLEEINTC